MSEKTLVGIIMGSTSDWEVMKEAKRQGCKYYDLFGIAPNEDEKHPWAGVTRFKRQFGGLDFASLGSWDLVISPMKYK